MWDPTPEDDKALREVVKEVRGFSYFIHVLHSSSCFLNVEPSAFNHVSYVVPEGVITERVCVVQTPTLASCINYNKLLLSFLSMRCNSIFSSRRLSILASYLGSGKLALVQPTPPKLVIERSHVRAHGEAGSSCRFVGMLRWRLSSRSHIALLHPRHFTDYYIAHPNITIRIWDSSPDSDHQAKAKGWKCGSHMGYYNSSSRNGAIRFRGRQAMTIL